MPLKIDGALEEHPKAVYASDGWEIDLARRELRSRGALVPLGSRTFEIIEVLVQSGGELVNKYDLMGRVWPGAIVEENTLQFHISVARKAFGADRGLLKTVSGRGYRLLGHWTIHEANDEAELVENGPPRLSMVVLPFANIGGGAEQEPFVDGVTESLTTDLSRIRGAYVVARNTAFTYKGKPLDVKTIGRELNVRYVLEGSVQRGGNRMRVNVQLIDAETGSHLWAERFDKPLADLFDMQDEIVARLASALNAHLIAAEARRAEQAPTPNSMDLYFQGRVWANRGPTPDNLAQACSFYDGALTADPDNVDALVGSADADTVAGASAFVANPTAAFDAAEAKLTKALSLVPDHAPGHMMLGHVYIYTKRAAQGIAECEHALELDRNLATAHAFIGFGKILIGRAEETEAHVGEAARLSPRDTSAHAWNIFVGIAKLTLGSYEHAVAWFRRAVEANRNYPIAHFLSAAGLAQLGRMDEAHSAVNAGLALNPAFSTSGARAAWTAMSDNPTYLASIEPVLEAMRKAGVPEQ